MRKSVPYAGRAMTLDQISQELGITKERVRQIEKRALEKLNDKLQRLGITASEFILPNEYPETKQ